ncbi:MAG: archaeosine tRNA-ribosyltransferase [Methanobacterium sp.]|uniref:archaeosine tRNA-ribosyltransferase n=1 Tax=Methanobacterium sp. TaxID=2164 RepID=UPI003D65C64D|nr:archaeosine tRNA-ribosyltransferase [Methanobacterium sp.]
MLLVKQHDGPARLGKYEEVITPAIFKSEENLFIIKDEPMPFDVPKELAEWSVKRTIQNASKSEEKGIAVIHGSKYVDLRVKCALKLDELGYTTLLVANSEMLLKNPRDLVDILVNLRETINPNIALYFPFADVNFIPILAYMGIDFFGEFTADYYAQLNVILTPTAKYNLEEYKIYDLNFDELKKYNKNSMDFVVREVRENIKNGTLRNLVEERCCTSPEAMSTLRLLDKKYPDFLEKYMPLY